MRRTGIAFEHRLPRGQGAVVLAITNQKAEIPAGRVREEPPVGRQPQHVELTDAPRERPAGLSGHADDEPESEGHDNRDIRHGAARLATTRPGTTSLPWP